MNFKFGRQPFIKDERDLHYRNYRATALPPIPVSFGHQGLIADWGMLGNDSVGDCTCAGADHGIMLWTAEGSNQAATFTAANTISDYSAITGYNPNDPNSDQGAQIRNVLSYQLKTGMIDASGKRHKIGAYLQIDQTNLNEVLEAAYLFSVVEIGINFPDSAMTQFNQGQPWTVVPGATIEGGHDVPIVGYDGTDLYVVTWGKLQKMSPDFFATYCEEAWVKLSPEFLNGQGVSPEGFNLAQLQADLAAIRNVQPGPPPVPDPTPQPVVHDDTARITLVMGSNIATVVKSDGSYDLVILDQPPLINPVTNRTLVPIGLLAPYMGFNAEWNPESPDVVKLVNPKFVTC